MSMTALVTAICCCDCDNLFLQLFGKEKQVQAENIPLLDDSKAIQYEEPLLVARIARVNSTGDWDHLQSLQTPSHWNSRMLRNNLSSPNLLASESPTITTMDGESSFRSYTSKDKYSRKMNDIELSDEDIEADDESNCDDFEDDSPTTVFSSRGRITRKKNSASISSGKVVHFKTHSTASMTAITENSSDGSSPRLKARYKGKSFVDLFSLGKQIGYGSTATVFQCYRKQEFSSSKTPLAVKVIDKKKLTGLGKRSRKQSNLLLQFRQEIEILDSLRHPHIIRIYGMFETSKNLHVVTELCEGGELFDFLTQHPETNFAGSREIVAKKIVFQVVSAVAYMHSQGIIHRDIKLENILLLKKIDIQKCVQEVGNIECKIIDFGLAKSVMKGATLNERLQGRAKTFFGTVGYLAPEMFNSKSYGNGVDVWAVGVLTYVLLCGSFPFDDSSASRKRPTNKHSLRKQYRIKYPGRVKKILSEDAKSFVSRLLETDAGSRLSSQDITSLPWLSFDA